MHLLLSAFKFLSTLFELYAGLFVREKVLKNERF